jgi:hypothetical protein
VVACERGPGRHARGERSEAHREEEASHRAQYRGVRRRRKSPRYASHARGSRRVFFVLVTKRCEHRVGRWFVDNRVGARGARTPLTGSHAGPWEGLYYI